VAVTAAVTALGAGTAGATVVDKGHYTSEPYSFSPDDCGFDVDVEGTSSGHFRLRAGKGKTDTAFFKLDNYSFTETQTNPDTGEFVTITANAIFNEIKAKRVEGSIFRALGNRGRSVPVVRLGRSARGARSRVRALPHPVRH
jgi:hypothetical protein